MGRGGSSERVSSISSGIQHLLAGRHQAHLFGPKHPASESCVRASTSKPACVTARPLPWPPHPAPGQTLQLEPPCRHGAVGHRRPRAQARAGRAARAGDGAPAGGAVLLRRGHRGVWQALPGAKGGLARRCVGGGLGWLGGKEGPAGWGDRACTSCLELGLLNACAREPATQSSL